MYTFISINWLYSGNALWPIMLGSLALFFTIIIFTRIVGLRSFAKFTAYDFAFTVAIGSIIASTLTSATTVVEGAVAIGSLLLLTVIFSYLQKKMPLLDNLISNDPLLLMDGDSILYENLKKARIQKSQLISKLREANVINFNQVRAVVLEATGDISVLHTSDSKELQEELLEGVKTKA